MGLFSFLSKVGRKAYDFFKKPVSQAYNFLKDGFSSLRGVGEWVDGALNNLHNIPVIGELATLIQADPLYQEIGAVFGEGERLLDLGGEIGRDVSRGIETGLGGLDYFAGVPSIGYRGGASQSPVGGGIRRANALTERSVPNVGPLSGSGGNSFAIS